VLEFSPPEPIIARHDFRVKLLAWITVGAQALDM
jgi:hypothetical protein